MYGPPMEGLIVEMPPPVVVAAAVAVRRIKIFTISLI